jgi:hypothetical protein
MFRCGKCQRQGEGERQMRVVRWPNILLIHLVRFTADGAKLSAPVEYPLVLDAADLHEAASPIARPSDDLGSPCAKPFPPSFPGAPISPGSTSASPQPAAGSDFSKGTHRRKQQPQLPQKRQQRGDGASRTPSTSSSAVCVDLSAADSIGQNLDHLASSATRVPVGGGVGGKNAAPPSAVGGMGEADASDCFDAANRYDPPSYRLSGVVLHRGTVGYGHYTAFVRAPDLFAPDSGSDGSSGDATETEALLDGPRTWYYCDDSQITPGFTDEQVLGCKGAAYMLFYEAIS